MSGYVDGFLLVVKRGKLAKYKKMAELGAKIWKKHGALQYFECVGDDLSPKMPGVRLPKFPKIIKARPGEKVIFSFIIYKSRAHRDAVNAKVMKDPLMNDPQYMPMPFDMKRMCYGGFKTIVKG